jgi:hypothetical protein
MKKNKKFIYNNYKMQISYSFYSKKKLKDIKKISCWVVSPGGVATTTLIDYLNNFVTTNCSIDTDLLKHRVNPPKNIDSFKVIFLKGDEKHILNSLKNRYLGDVSFYYFQFFKMESPFNFLSTIQKKEKRFLELIKIQETNWLNKNNTFEILSIEYKDLFESALEISQFLEINDSEFISNFPKKNK